MGLLAAILLLNFTVMMIDIIAKAIAWCKERKSKKKVEEEKKQQKLEG